MRSKICEEGRPVICLYTFQSMTNLQNCWFVISETMEGILINAGGGLNAAELCDMRSAAGAASVAMCCRMASWSPSALISIFSKCSAVSPSTVR